MRTARLLPIYPSMHCSGGCTCLGVYLPVGVYLPGGMYLSRGSVTAQGWCTCPKGDVPAWGGYLPGGCTCLGGVPAQGGVPTWGVYLPGGVPAWGDVPVQGQCNCPGAVYLPKGDVPAWGGCPCLGVGTYWGCTCPGTLPPVNRILDTRYWKYSLAPNFVCGR